MSDLLSILRSKAQAGSCRPLLPDTKLSVAAWLFVLHVGEGATQVTDTSALIKRGDEIAADCNQLESARTFAREAAAALGEMERLRGATDGHPEDYCHRCGGRNIGWYADSDLWNRFDPPESIICPICFVIEAEAKGVTTPAWRVAPEDISDEKQRLFVRLHEQRDRLAELEQKNARLSGRVGNLHQEIKQIKRGIIYLTPPEISV